MKKLITGLLITIFATTSAFAMNAIETTSISTDTTKLTCASSAVVKREDAIIAAHDTMSAAVKSAMVARRDSLKVAWSITDKRQREAARKASWSKFRVDTQAAHNLMRETRKASWSSFESSMKICGIKDHKEKASVVANPTYAY